MDGIINIYKEKGFTSHDVVAVVRKIIGQKKVGHTGTLDPEALGVLPVCVGKGTKLADYIMAERKTYVTEITLGVTTTTEDHTGDIVEEKDFVFDEKKIKKAVESFIGEYMQVPPMYSAIKVNGKKLYDLAREGKNIERSARKVTIYNIDINEFLPPNKVKITVDCSKGTYIRTLCSDIGKELGCGAHMSYLLRSASGFFKIDSAITLEQLKDIVSTDKINEVLIPIDKALENYKKIRISEKSDKYLKNGCKIYSLYFDSISEKIFENDYILAYDYNNIFVGIYMVLKDFEKESLYIKPIKILL